jgi:hypothetical protein
MNLPRKVFGILSGVLTVLFLATPLQAEDEKVKSRMVYCDKGQDPAAVLNQERGPQRLEMTLVGTCPGFSVTRDDVRIEGDDEYGCPAANASVEGTIRFLGAQRAVVACLSVTGPGNGIEAPNSSVLIGDSSVSGNAGAGVTATSGASVNLSRSQVMNNGGSGIEIYTNSSADIDDSEITGNGTSGGATDLYLFLQSTATGQGNTIGTTYLRLDSAVSLDGPSIGSVVCEDTKSSALVNGDVPPGCTDY